MKTKKVVVGVRLEFNKDKMPREMEVVNKIPIYADWTPELQEKQDKMYEHCAFILAHDLMEYAKSGGDMSNLTVKGVYSHLRRNREALYNKAVPKEQKEEIKPLSNKGEILKKDNNEEIINVDVKKSDYQEFLNWKKDNNV